MRASVCCSPLARSFSPGGSDITLHSVMSLRLDAHADFIASLSVTASKEQAIEVRLSGIEATWTDLRLDMTQHKGVQHKLRSADDIFAALEDSSVVLNSMKASRHYLAFESAITRWEATLTLVSETLEVILQVQRSWTYLENIFVGAGSDDIRRQLPDETATFDSVDASFTRAMQRLHSVGNVIVATTADGLRAEFQARLPLQLHDARGGGAGRGGGGDCLRLPASTPAALRSLADTCSHLAAASLRPWTSGWSVCRSHWKTTWKRSDNASRASIS